MALASIQNGYVKIFLIFIVPVLSWPAWAAPQAALVVDATTNTVLFAHNAQQHRHPASLTKIMTLYLMFDAIKQKQLTLQQPLKVSKRAAARPPSKLGLRAGSTITVEQVILALVTRSANDAATVIAETLGKTESHFGHIMTKTARRLGMQKTTFRNASGLPDSRQITTAWDMYLLASALQKDFPEFYHYFSKSSFRFGKKIYKNHNHLLATYAGTDGIKTGYIRASGFNLVSSVKRDGKHLIGVVFGGSTAKRRDAHMQAILDQGFTQLAANPPTQRVERLTELPTVTLIARSTPTRMTSTPENNVSLISFDDSFSATDSSTLDQSNFDADGFDWKIQVGAFSQVSAAKQWVSKIVQTSSGMLSSGQAVILPIAKDGKTLYRAYFEGFTEIEATGLCDILEQQRFDCFPLAPSNS
jgi:D-alanyl-D-alanine carboxypeptidase